jgi:hypothetical protein
MVSLDRYILNSNRSNIYRDSILVEFRSIVTIQKNRNNINIIKNLKSGCFLSFGLVIESAILSAWLAQNKSILFGIV